MSAVLLMLFTLAMSVGAGFSIAAIVRREHRLRELRRAVEKVSKP